MLYESDLNNLLSQWKERMNEQTDSAYKDAVSDCIYDLNSLLDKSLSDEALALESFHQQVKENEQYWNDYFNNLIADGIFA